MRQFIAESFPDKKGLLVLEGEDFKYFRQVLRIKAGDMVSVRLPDESLQNMTACSIDDKNRRLTLQICADTANFSEKELTRGVKASEINSVMKTEYWLFQFLPKIPKFEQIVKQAVECGVTAIIPVIGEYTEKASIIAMENPAKIERLNKLIKEARQQSGSPVDTRLYMPVNLVEACRLWKSRAIDEESAAFVLSERNEKSVSMTKSLSGRDVDIAAIAVGCEGGISPDEMNLLTEPGLFEPVHFEGNILRCETAALYGIAALQVISTKG